MFCMFRVLQEIRKQLEGLARDQGLAMSSCGKSADPLLRCLTASCFLHVAKAVPSITGGRSEYRVLATGVIVHLHPSSALFGQPSPPECVVYNELVVTKKSYIRAVSRVRPEWLAGEGCDVHCNGAAPMLPFAVFVCLLCFLYSFFLH